MMSRPLPSEGCVELPYLVVSPVVEVVPGTGREVHELEPNVIGKEIDQIFHMTAIQIVQVLIESTSAGLDCLASLDPHSKICKFTDHRIYHLDILLSQAAQGGPGQP